MVGLQDSMLQRCYNRCISAGCLPTKNKHKEHDTIIIQHNHSLKLSIKLQL